MGVVSKHQVVIRRETINNKSYKLKDHPSSSGFGTAKQTWGLEAGPPHFPSCLELSSYGQGWGMVAAGTTVVAVKPR